MTNFHCIFFYWNSCYTECLLNLCLIFITYISLFYSSVFYTCIYSLFILSSYILFHFSKSTDLIYCFLEIILYFQNDFTCSILMSSLSCLVVLDHFFIKLYVKRNSFSCTLFLKFQLWLLLNFFFLQPMVWLIKNI